MSQETYTRTAEQNAILNSATIKIAAIRKEAGTNTIKAIRDLIPAYIKEEFAGNSKAAKGDEPAEVNENHVKRILLLSAMLNVAPERIASSKASTTALQNALGAMLLGESIAESVDVIAKVKEAEADDVELALEGAFSSKLKASAVLRKLSEKDAKDAQAASHAAFHTALQMLRRMSETRATAEKNDALRFPKGAENFLSYLIAASNGNTEWFEMTDNFIVKASGISKATIKRNRTDLKEWMEAFGNGSGIIDIHQEMNKPTRYKVNLLDATTSIMMNLLSGEHADPTNLLIVAGLAAKVLSEGTERLKGRVSDSELESAKYLNAMLQDAVNTMPSPNIVLSTSAEGASKSAALKALDAIGKKISRGVTMANEANLADIEARLTKLAVNVSRQREAYEADSNALPKTDALQAEVDRLYAEIEASLKTETDKAQEKAQAELAATGEVSTETAREIATSYAKAVTSPDQAEEEKEAAYDSVKNKMLLYAELARKQTESAQSENAFQEAFIAMHDLVDEVFGAEKSDDATA